MFPRFWISKALHRLLFFNGIVRHDDQFFGTLKTENIATLRHFKVCVLAFQTALNFCKSIQIATPDGPLKDVVGAAFTSQWPIFWYPFTYQFRVYSFNGSYESLSEWIFINKDVLESQDADLKMS